MARINELHLFIVMPSLLPILDCRYLHDIEKLEYNAQLTLRSIYKEVDIGTTWIPTPE